MVSINYQFPTSHKPAIDVPTSTSCAAANLLKDFAVIFFNFLYPIVLLTLKQSCMLPPHVLYAIMAFALVISHKSVVIGESIFELINAFQKFQLTNHVTQT